MTHLLRLIAAAGLLSGTGCLGLRPVGPMADSLQPREQAAVKKSDTVKVTAAKDAPGGPAVVPAPPPPAPTLRVSPAEVTDANASAAADRLAEEIEADKKAMEAMPRYAEVSVIKK